MSDFPGSPVVKNLPANTGDMGLISGPRKISQAAGQPSPCATTIDHVLYNKRSHCSEKPADCNQRVASTVLNHTQQLRPSAAKNK